MGMCLSDHGGHSNFELMGYFGVNVDAETTQDKLGNQPCLSGD